MSRTRVGENDLSSCFPVLGLAERVETRTPSYGRGGLDQYPVGLTLMGTPLFGSSLRLPVLGGIYPLYFHKDYITEVGSRGGL